jgi:uncharacterized protein (TIGR02284 family)
MKTITEKTEKALRELVIINNDRTEGYHKAAEEAKDGDLKILFNKFSSQSRRFAEELKELMPVDADIPDDEKTKMSGKLYRVWMDMKNAIAGNNRKSVLSSCEFGEDVAKKTYDDVLADAEDISAEALALIRRQRSEIQEGHDTVKSMRDRA